MSLSLDEIAERLINLPPAQRQEIAKLSIENTRDLPHWAPNFGPQRDAFYCLADELLYGGEAGGGKTDLLLGTAIQSHIKSLVLRRLNHEVTGLIERMEKILGHTRGLKRSAPAHWRLAHRLIMFGGCQHPEDWQKYRGDPKDLIAFDEVTNFLEAQYRAIVAWNRSVVDGQRVRVIATCNPPDTPEGAWVIRYWGPWLDPNHPQPAADGELRWFTTIDGKDTQVDGPGPITLSDGSTLVDKHGKPILPRSRTFIRAQLKDNPDLEASNYSSVLHALPEHMRAGLAEGDFAYALRDSEHQTIPREWLELAFARWHESGRNSKMTVIAGDLAEARDRSVLQRRHGGWFDKQLVRPGRETPDGPTTAAWIITEMRNGCEVVIDMGGGYGASTRDHLRHQARIEPTLYNGAASAEGLRDRTGTHKFRNIRAAAIWSLREALDPTYGANIAICPDNELREEALAHKHFNGIGGIQIIEKEEIKELLGRSPDRFDALVMAHFAKGRTEHERFAMTNLQTTANNSGRNPRRR